MEKLNVAIADDNEKMVEVLSKIIDQDEDLKLVGKIAFKNIKVKPTEADTILVSGSTVGIYMETDGVLVIDTGEILSKNGQMQDPAKNILKPGDYIVALNEQKISCKQDLINDLETIDGKPVTVSVRRNNSTIPVSLSPAQDASGKYKLGIWVRDDTQGIGTLTYEQKTEISVLLAMESAISTQEIFCQ